MNKFKRLLGDKPFLKVLSTLLDTFKIISKWATTYTSKGLLRDWIDRQETPDLKLLHHMFLLQNVDTRVTFDSKETLGKMYFPQTADKKKQPYRRIFISFRRG